MLISKYMFYVAHDIVFDSMIALRRIEFDMIARASVVGKLGEARAYAMRVGTQASVHVLLIV